MLPVRISRDATIARSVGRSVVCVCMHDCIVYMCVFMCFHVFVCFLCMCLCDCVYMCRCLCLCVLVFVGVCVYLYLCICIYVFVCACGYACVFMFLGVSVRACVFVFVSVCVYLYVCVCMYMFVYVFACMFALLHLPQNLCSRWSEVPSGHLLVSSRKAAPPFLSPGELSSVFFPLLYLVLPSPSESGRHLADWYD